MHKNKSSKSHLTSDSTEVVKDRMILASWILAGRLLPAKSLTVALVLYSCFGNEGITLHGQVRGQVGERNPEFRIKGDLLKTRADVGPTSGNITARSGED